MNIAQNFSKWWFISQRKISHDEKLSRQKLCKKQISSRRQQGVHYYYFVSHNLQSFLVPSPIFSAAGRQIGPNVPSCSLIYIILSHHSLMTSFLVSFSKVVLLLLFFAGSSMAIITDNMFEALFFGIGWGFPPEKKHCITIRQHSFINGGLCGGRKSKKKPVVCSCLSGGCVRVEKWHRQTNGGFFVPSSWESLQNQSKWLSCAHAGCIHCPLPRAAAASSSLFDQNIIFPRTPSTRGWGKGCFSS